MHSCGDVDCEIQMGVHFKSAIFHPQIKFQNGCY